MINKINKANKRFRGLVLTYKLKKEVEASILLAICYFCLQQIVDRNIAKC